MALSICIEYVPTMPKPDTVLPPKHDDRTFYKTEEDPQRGTAFPHLELLETALTSRKKRLMDQRPNLCKTEDFQDLSRVVHSSL